MIETLLHARLTNIYRIIKSIERTLELLEKTNDKENIEKVRGVKHYYSEKFLELFESAKLERVTLYPDEHTEITFTMNHNKTTNHQKGV